VCKAAEEDYYRALDMFPSTECKIHILLTSLTFFTCIASNSSANVGMFGRGQKAALTAMKKEVDSMPVSHETRIYQDR